MKNYKFNRTNKILTDEEILKQKPDFDALLKMNSVMIKPKNYWNSKWWLVGGGSAVFVGFVLMVLFNPALKKERLRIFNNKKSRNTDTVQIDDKSGATIFVNHSKKNIGEGYEINPVKKNIISTENGNLIEIPAYAFVDKNGKKVKEPVRISFKDYYKAYDIYRSGISMRYDSAGKSYSFESAGMFDIQAFVDNNPVFIASGKSISISFLTTSVDKRFNFYSRDEKKDNWVYCQKAKVKPFAYYVENEVRNEYFNQDLTAKEKKEHNLNLSSQTAGPAFFSKKEVSGVFYAYDINVDFNHFSMLRDLLNKSRLKAGEKPIRGRSARMQFYIPTEDEEYTTKMFATTWLQMKLINKVGRNQFRMKFANRDTTVYAIVKPIASDNDSVFYVDRSAKNQLKQEEMKRIEDLRKKWQKQTNEMIEKFVKAINVYPKGVCKVEIRTLGIKNVDYPWARLQNYFLKYYDEQNKEIPAGLVYAYNKVKKTVEKYTLLTSMVGFYGNDAYLFWIADKKSIHLTSFEVPYQELGKLGFDKKIRFKSYSMKNGLEELKRLMSYDPKVKS